MRVSTGGGTRGPSSWNVGRIRSEGDGMGRKAEVEGWREEWGREGREGRVKEDDGVVPEVR